MSEMLLIGRKLRTAWRYGAVAAGTCESLEEFPLTWSMTFPPGTEGTVVRPDPIPIAFHHAPPGVKYYRVEVVHDGARYEIPMTEADIVEQLLTPAQ